MRGAHHIRRADFEAETHGDRVQRHRQRLRQRHRAEIFAAVVLRRPALDVERRILPHGVGRQAGFDGGEIDERLERRARLALRGHRAVELAFRIIAAADHARAPRRSGVIATSAPCETLNFTLLAASSSMIAASATL